MREEASERVRKICVIKFHIVNNRNAVYFLLSRLSCTWQGMIMVITAQNLTIKILFNGIEESDE